MELSQKVSEYANGSAFRIRVKFFLLKASISVMAEDVGTPSHTERLAFASKLISGEANPEQYAIAVSTNATISGYINSDTDPIDSDLEFTVNSMFTAFSL